MIRKLAVAAALLLTLTACGDDATTGRVTNVVHVGQHDEVSYFDCIAIGNNACAVMIPYYETVPECWTIQFHNDPADEDGQACVSEQEFGTYSIGDQFPHPR